MARKIYPSDENRITISFTEAQLKHFCGNVPPRKRSAAIRHAMIASGLIPSDAQTKTPTAA